MSKNHSSTFAALRDVLRAHAEGLRVAADTSSRFSLEAPVGPATLAAWGGKQRRSQIPVAWVERRKSYVSYHLIGLDGNASALTRLSPALRAHLHGKTCFNFQDADAALLAELDSATASTLQGLRRAGFIERRQA